MEDIELSTNALPNRIREIRKSRGMTIEELADAVTRGGQQLHKSTLSKLESGERNLKIAMAEAIADILRVPVSEITAPSDRPIVLMVPIIGWEDLPDALAGAEFKGREVVPVIMPATSRLVAMRLVADVDPRNDEDKKSARPPDVLRTWRFQLCLDGVAVIELGDEVTDAGVFVGQWGRYSGIYWYDGDGYQDCSSERSGYIDRPRIIGRVIQCIVEPGRHAPTSDHHPITTSDDDEE